MLRFAPASPPWSSRGWVVAAICCSPFCGLPSGQPHILCLTRTLLGLAFYQPRRVSSGEGEWVGYCWGAVESHSLRQSESGDLVRMCLSSCSFSLCPGFSLPCQPLVHMAAGFFGPALRFGAEAGPEPRWEPPDCSAWHPGSYHWALQLLIGSAA